MLSTTAQTMVKQLDLHRYAGKWFVIAAIPTRFDKNWSNVTETYHVKENGNVGIFTTYKTGANGHERSVKSKGFPVSEKKNLAWKVQFVWPFKADYLVEEINEDYSYVVVGHPKKKFLYIMNRTGIMGHIQMEEIKNRMAKKGYDLNDLKAVKQDFL